MNTSNDEALQIEIDRLKRELADALSSLKHYGYDGNMRCSICQDLIVGGCVGNGLEHPDPEWRHEECDRLGKPRWKVATT